MPSVRAPSISVRAALALILVSASGSVSAEEGRELRVKERQISAAQATRPSSSGSAKGAAKAAPSSSQPSAAGPAGSEGGASSTSAVPAAPEESLEEGELPPPLPAPPPAVRPPLPKIARSESTPRAIQAAAPEAHASGPNSAAPNAPSRTRDVQVSQAVAEERTSQDAGREAASPRREDPAGSESSASAAPAPAEAKTPRIRTTVASDARPVSSETKPEEPPRFVYETGEWVRAVDYGWIWIPKDLTVSSSGSESYVYLYTPLYGWSWYLAPWGSGPYRWGSWAVHSAIGMAFWADHREDFLRRRSKPTHGGSRGGVRPLPGTREGSPRAHGDAQRGAGARERSREVPRAGRHQQRRGEGAERGRATARGPGRQFR